jgi:hypothetical protein
MIFSFFENGPVSAPLETEGTDLFCFFKTPTSILVPEAIWLLSICASLKLKKNVLILEEPLTKLPSLDITSRWQVGERFLWLAPRSLSVLLEAQNKKTSTYESLKESLSNFK